MRSDTEYRWWNIFIPRENLGDGDNCPGFVMNDSRSWQKGLVDLYCPCRADSMTSECQLLTGV